MTPKELIFNQEARLKLAKGIEAVVGAVAFTFGPKGRNAGIHTFSKPPFITHHGNEIVKNIELKDQYLEMGASIAKEAAAKVQQQCGDGTTLTMLLLGAFVKEALKHLAAGVSPIALKRGIDKSVAALVQLLEKQATSVQTPEEILKMATMGGQDCVEIGSVIAKAIESVGKEGVITVEKGKATETTVEITQGMRFNQGYLSPYFCTQSDPNQIEMENVKILLAHKKIESIQEILPLIQMVSSLGQNLLIIADDIKGDAFSTLVLNQVRGTLKVCAVKAPEFGEGRQKALQDISALTGASIVSEETGQTISAQALGEVAKALVTKDHTTLIGGKGNLSGGVAVIRVGSLTDLEMEQKVQRFRDSLNATQAAIKSGVVIGGGVALLRASLDLSVSLSQEEKIGALILQKACASPLRQIVTNAGLDSSLVIEQLQQLPPTFGFNALSNQIEDLSACKIVDSANVVIAALQCAASAATVVILSELLIGNAPEDHA